MVRLAIRAPTEVLAEVADTEAALPPAASMGLPKAVAAGMAAEEQLTASLHRNTGVPLTRHRWSGLGKFYLIPSPVSKARAVAEALLSFEHSSACLAPRSSIPDRISHTNESWCRSNNSAVARNEAPPAITPIANLNAYHSRWTIRARITSKSEMRRFSNARGEGALRHHPGALAVQSCLAMVRTLNLCCALW
jgi:hypothetical protein